MMMQAGREKPLYKTSLDCVRTIWAHEGYRGFYRGLSVNLVRGVGGSALLVLYDEIRLVLGNL
ncbi:unnamed protein product [Discosporangium mesarthrocarpum]